MRSATIGSTFIAPSDPFSTGRARQWATVVGVIRHLRHRTLLEDLNDQIYFSERQVRRNPAAYFVRVAPGDADPGALSAPIKRAVAALDPELAVADMLPLDEYVNAARTSQRFSRLLALAFGSSALLLATIGVYGVIAYATERRRYEFGVRLALGAQPLGGLCALRRWMRSARNKPPRSRPRCRVLPGFAAGCFELSL